MTDQAIKLEHARIDKLLTQQEQLIKRQFLIFISLTTSSDPLIKVKAFIANNNIEGVLRLLEGYIFNLSNVFGTVLINSATQEAAIWSVRLGLITQTQNLFNIADERVGITLSKNRHNFITNMQRQQRELIRQALIDGMRMDETSEQLTTRYKNTVGLTRAQYRSVNTYRLSLMQNNNDTANDNLLHMTGLDIQVQKAIDENDKLTTNQITLMVDRYIDNLRRDRAKTIANTEALRILNQGRNIAVRQVATIAGLDPRSGTKRWITTMDGRERDTHAALNGDEVDMDEPFVSPSGANLMTPGDTSLGAPPQEIINCR